MPGSKLFCRANSPAQTPVASWLSSTGAGPAGLFKKSPLSLTPSSRDSKAKEEKKPHRFTSCSGSLSPLSMVFPPLQGWALLARAALLAPSFCSIPSASAPCLSLPASIFLLNQSSSLVLWVCGSASSPTRTLAMGPTFFTHSFLWDAAAWGVLWVPLSQSGVVLFWLPLSGARNTFLHDPSVNLKEAHSEEMLQCAPCSS